MLTDGGPPPQVSDAGGSSAASGSGERAAGPHAPAPGSESGTLALASSSSGSTSWTDAFQDAFDDEKAVQSSSGIVTFKISKQVVEANVSLSEKEAGIQYRNQRLDMTVSYRNTDTPDLWK